MIEVVHIVIVNPIQIVEVVHEVILLQEEVDQEVVVIQTLIHLVRIVVPYLALEAIQEVVTTIMISPEVVLMIVVVKILVMLLDKIIVMYYVFIVYLMYREIGRNRIINEVIISSIG